MLIIGLVLSIALMGFAASFIASLLNKHRWIAYVGLLAIILYVALKMMWEGWHEDAARTRWRNCRSCSAAMDSAEWQGP